jgi:transketolase
MDLQETKSIEAFALRIRMAALEAIHSIGSGHVGGVMSISDTMAVLYGREMRFNPADPKWADRDYLVVSKGHAGPAVYATLALKGFFPYEELKTLNRGGTRLPSHCDRNKTPGVDVTTGSLGQGTSQAAGLALGNKLKGRSSRVFLIVGDGEMDEGEIWESIMAAYAWKLDNLVIILDNNGLQIDGTNDQVMSLGDLPAKLRAFGFEVFELPDGHDLDAIEAALSAPVVGKPKCILAHTVKGKGVSFMEGVNSWHHASMNEEQYNQAIEELK